MHLGTPFEKLRAAGIIADELTLSPTVLNRKLKQHDLTTDDLKGLSKAIQDPILVYKHGLNIPNIIVITEIDVKGGKLSISVVLDSDGNVLNVNNVSSVHSKDAATELTRLEDYSENELKNALGWVEKEKVLDWLSTAPLYGGMHTNNPKLNSITNIIQNFENLSIGEENIPLFHIIGKISASRMDGLEMELGELVVAKEMENEGTLKDNVLKLFQKAAKCDLTGKPNCFRTKLGQG